MAKIVSLLDSDAAVTRALDALAAAGFEALEPDIIYGASETGSRPGPVAAPTTQVPGGQGGQAVVPLTFEADWRLSEEEAAFFLQGVRNGGVLVLMEVDDDEVDAVDDIFRQHDGRTWFQVT